MHGRSFPSARVIAVVLPLPYVLNVLPSVEPTTIVNVCIQFAGFEQNWHFEKIYCFLLRWFRTLDSFVGFWILYLRWFLGAFGNFCFELWEYDVLTALDFVVFMFWMLWILLLWNLDKLGHTTSRQGGKYLILDVWWFWFWIVIVLWAKSMVSCFWVWMSLEWDGQ